MAPTIVDDVREITPAWIESVLAADGTDARVEAVTTMPVGTGQMASCVRVHVTYAAGSGPATLVAKLASDDVADRARSAIGYRCEVGFYRDVAPRIATRLPRCHVALVDDDGLRLTLLLEDLAPAEQGDQILGCTAAQARAAAVNIAPLHAATWCDETLRDLEWTVPFPLGDDEEGAAFLAAVLADATASFLDRLTVTDTARRVLEQLPPSFGAWSGGRTTPFSLIHGDHRLDNLLFAPAEPARRGSADGGPDAGSGAGDPVIAVDWQTVSVGRPLCDVTFLVAAGLDPADRRVHERALVDDYHHALLAAGVEGYDAAQCWDDYRYALVHPLMITVLGALVSKPSERGDRMFTAMADRVAAAIDDHGTFDLIP